MRTAADSWRREWEECSSTLFRLLACAEHDMLALSQLLQRVRWSQATLSEAPSPGLQALADRVLDEIWKAGWLSIYGDLCLAEDHTAAAREHVREIRTLLSAPV